MKRGGIPSFDGMTLFAIRRELCRRLIGGRIGRIYHPEPYVLTMEIFTWTSNEGGLYPREETLLLSAHPVYARVHLTYRKRANPAVPSAFCMLLRKRLEGGRIIDIQQDGLERVLRVQVQGLGEGGQIEAHTLAVELMGKHSNIVLINGSGRVVDALHRLPERTSRYRTVLPGNEYIAPPPSGKLPLITPDGENVSPDLARLPAVWPDKAEGEGKTAWRALLELVEGIGQANARAVLRRAGLDPETPASACNKGDLERITETLQDATRELIRSGVSPWMGSSNNLSASRLVDEVFWEAESLGRLASERQYLKQVVSSCLNRARRRLQAQIEEEREAGMADAYRTAGELLISQLHSVKPGADSVELVDYYDPEQRSRRIELDPSLSPVANAQAYFKKYARARRIGEAAKEKVERTREEIAYLETVETAIDLADSIADLNGIREELREGGFIQPASPAAAKRQGRRDGRKDVRKEPPKHDILTFISSDGLEIMVGKNNKQNEWLTLRVASGGDLWLHTRQIPGSHVVVRLPARSQTDLDMVPEKTLLEAASLAAWFSKARHSSNVPVDYTHRRNVHKPKGAKLGMVVYSGHRTISVTPDPTLPERLHRSNRFLE